MWDLIFLLMRSFLAGGFRNSLAGPTGGLSGKLRGGLYAGAHDRQKGGKPGLTAAHFARGAREI